MSNFRKSSIFTATLWVLIAYGLSQLIRLISNIFVSRLLAPEMFGVMAIVQSIMIGLEMFSDMGFWAYIVRHKDGNDEKLLNVVWTLQVVRGWIMFFILTFIGLSVMLINLYCPSMLQGVYADDRLPILIFIVGLTAILNGYKSMYAAVMSRDLKRGRVEFVQLLAQIAASIIMVIWAWVSPTIWALVSAYLVSSLMLLISGYLFFPIRHKISWDKAIRNDVFQFGKWIVFASALTFIAQQGDRVFFGAILSADILGIYSIAFMLANTLSTITQQISTKIVYPVLASSVNLERTVLKHIYYKIRLKVDAAVFFVSGILIFFAPNLIEVLYDSRYEDAGWMLQILIVSVIGTVLSAVAQECLSALAITKVRMQIMLVRTIGLIIGLPVGYELFGLQGAIWAVSLNVWLGLPLMYRYLAKNNLFSWFHEVKQLPIVVVSYFMSKTLFYYV